ncbi:MAG: helix-turn-helix domain-containing protein [Clostridia bacterium]|nr:helix-turn-helix domain-containing protein [Clostridia bacterium]
MRELKEVIAENLTRLRQEAGLTQLQLAEMLNYSDKAVSKWERGESIPDLRVIIQLADIYHMTVDDIVREQKSTTAKPRLNLRKKHLLIALLSAGLAWVIATGVFMILFYTQASPYAYLAYVVAPFVSFVVLTVFAGIWASRWVLWLTASAVIWSIVLIVHVFIWQFGTNISVWPFYVVAGAVEIMVIGWFVLRKLYKPIRKIAADKPEEQSEEDNLKSE